VHPLRIWGAGKTSEALQADLLSRAWPAPYGACATDGSYPDAADVRVVIEYGLSRGWQPDNRGGTFLISERDVPALELPKFLVTDRLRDGTAADPTARVISASGQQRHGTALNADRRVRRAEPALTGQPGELGLPHQH
jgi:hypothetical protein